MQFFLDIRFCHLCQNNLVWKLKSKFKKKKKSSLEKQINNDQVLKLQLEAVLCTRVKSRGKKPRLLQCGEIQWNKKTFKYVLVWLCQCSSWLQKRCEKPQQPSPGKTKEYQEYQLASSPQTTMSSSKFILTILFIF